MLHLNSRCSILTVLLLLNLLFTSCGRGSPPSRQELGQQQEQSEKPSQNVQVVTQESSTLSKDEVIRRAKLTPEQGEKLVSLIGNSKDFEKNNVIVLPTNVPDGFIVDEINLWSEKSGATHVSPGFYEIVYKNTNGACFRIKGGETVPIGEGGQNFEEISNIQSPALGSVNLFFRYSAEEEGGTTMEFSKNKGRNEYSLESPFLGVFLNSKSEESFNYYRQKYKDCKMMNLKDAKKFVESLQFLNP